MAQTRITGAVFIGDDFHGDNLTTKVHE
jgi:hypothetical protein